MAVAATSVHQQQGHMNGILGEQMDAIDNLRRMNWECLYRSVQDIDHVA